MLELRDRECYLLFCLIIFIIVVPCYSHESLFDGKTLFAEKELWKQTLPLQSGSRVYKLEGLKSNSWYEVKISYPASIPALFSLQLLRNGEMGLKLNQMKRLLNTEKLIFKAESLKEVNDKDGLYVLVTVEPEGIVAIPAFNERSFIIYNIVCEEQLLGIAYLCWSVVVLVVFCVVVAVILPRFLPSYLLIKDFDRNRKAPAQLISRRSIWLITRMVFFPFLLHLCFTTLIASRCLFNLLGLDSFVLYWI